MSQPPAPSLDHTETQICSLPYPPLACFYLQALLPIFLPTWLVTGQAHRDTLIPLHLGEEAAEAQRPRGPGASLAKLEGPVLQACTAAFLPHSRWASVLPSRLPQDGCKVAVSALAESKGRY